MQSGTHSHAALIFDFFLRLAKLFSPREGVEEALLSRAEPEVPIFARAGYVFDTSTAIPFDNLQRLRPSGASCVEIYTTPGPRRRQVDVAVLKEKNFSFKTATST